MAQSGNLSEVEKFYFPVDFQLLQILNLMLATALFVSLKHWPYHHTISAWSELKYFIEF